MKRALTIAGSDSGGGAGIQADLKTFAALGVYGMSALTSVTAQNTVGVRGVHDLPPEFVALQIDMVVEDIGVDAVKTGMLSTAAIIAAVADRVRAHGLESLVVDPVMVAKSGDPLLQAEARDSLVRLLLPLARVVTPNLHEARVLCGAEIRSLEEMKAAARAIHALGPRSVVVKGGHLEGSRESVDVLYDGREYRSFTAPRFDTPNTHGTGCTFASAIAAGLAKGADGPEAVRAARGYVTGAIRAAVEMKLGHGHGPLHHFFAVRPA
ncbi:MAG: bifunctional hydroxymethylpyrimidine kinase/phosphomethylpyrimidine kinase [Deltaproteobacteria bacterium]|nr:bifunctional hydroxymethylpyrimidine kinase/phosphomethylpyrimidine kinase [Deltaproteobacteria bacterium]